MSGGGLWRRPGRSEAEGTEGPRVESAASVWLVTRKEQDEAESEVNWEIPWN